MIQFIKYVVVFSLALSVNSCEKKQTVSDKTVSDSLAEEKREQLLPADAPEWYTQQKVAEGFLYGRGMGRSMRANIARDKALLKAQAELAAKISQDSLSYTSVLLKDVQIIEQKQVQEGNHWRVYVLVESAIDSINSEKD